MRNALITFLVPKEEADLKRELNRLMFVKSSTWLYVYHSKTPLSVTEDITKFAGILQAFYGYEKAVS